MANSATNNLLYRLLKRGDRVSVEQGQLRIMLNSGDAIPEVKYKDYQQQIITEIAELLSLEVYRYSSYSTGRYGKHKSQGLTLTMTNTITGEEAYCCFNVLLNYTRGKKKGQPLPKRQFRVTEKHHFYKFWASTGLALPPRLSSFHDYMGKLSQRIFIGHADHSNKLTEKMIPLLEVNARELLNAYQCKIADNGQTTARQVPDNCHTREPDKHSTQELINRSFEGGVSTCENKYELSKQGSTLIRSSLSPINPPIKPEDQTNEQWFANYDAVRNNTSNNRIKTGY